MPSSKIKKKTSWKEWKESKSKHKNKTQSQNKLNRQQATAKQPGFLNYVKCRSVWWYSNSILKSFQEHTLKKLCLHCQYMHCKIWSLYRNNSKEWKHYETWISAIYFLIHINRRGKWKIKYKYANNISSR